MAVSRAAAEDSAAAAHRADGSRRRGNMKNLAEKFLSQADHERIRKAVADAEKKTAGEIVCMVVSSSYPYPLANVLGATAVALPASLLGTHFLGARLWIGSQNMWLFLGLFSLCFALFYWAVERFPALKRRFISLREIDAEVEEAAINTFFRQGLYRTRDATGVLLFISVFEHKVWLLADQGIHEKVPRDEWDALMVQITRGIREGHRTDAICGAIQTIGQRLESHFPVKADDTDELKNLIIEDG
jgi:putative membrane protein